MKPIRNGFGALQPHNSGLYLPERCTLDLWSGSLCYTTGFTAKITGIVYCRFVNSPTTSQVMSGGAPRGSFAIQTPEIIFSEWYSWKDVKSIPHGEHTGIYIIARFDQKPKGVANPNAKEVLYIGETHGKSQSIHKRLNTFFKAARSGAGNHSGGCRFNKLFGNDFINVYVAGFAPMIEDAPYLTPFICYAERKLIWKYIVTHSTIPSCNGY